MLNRNLNSDQRLADAPTMTIGRVGALARSPAGDPAAPKARLLLPRERRRRAPTRWTNSDSRFAPATLVKQERQVDGCLGWIGRASCDARTSGEQDLRRAAVNIKLMWPRVELELRASSRREPAAALVAAVLGGVAGWILFFAGLERRSAV